MPTRQNKNYSGIDSSLWLDHCHIYQDGRPIPGGKIGTVSQLKEVMEELEAKKAVVFGNPIYTPPRIDEEQFIKEAKTFILGGSLRRLYENNQRRST